MKDEDTKEMTDAELGKELLDRNDAVAYAGVHPGAHGFAQKIGGLGGFGFTGVKAPFAQDKVRTAHPGCNDSPTLLERDVEGWSSQAPSPGQRILNLTSTLLGRSAVVLGNVQCLASRVCGALPRQEGDESKSPPPNGLLDKLANDLATAVERVEEIQAEINRLSEALSFDLSL